MTVAFSNVIRKQIEKYVASTAAANSETIHVIRFDAKDRLFDIFVGETQKRTQRISSIDQIQDGIYNLQNSRGIYLYARHYRDIQRILRNIERTTAFKKEAGVDYDLEQYTNHDVLLNMQKKIPLSLIKKLSGGTDKAFVKYEAMSNTVVTKTDAMSSLVLKIKNTNIDTNKLEDFFTKYVYIKGKALTKRISTNYISLFEKQKPKPYKKKQSTSGMVKKKVSKRNVIPHEPTKLTDIKGKFTSTIKIMGLLQPLVTKFVKANMDSAMYFKTKFNVFTPSVQIENVTRINKKLSIDYSYSSNYNRFQVGGDMHKFNRSPESVIEGSIRLAAAQVIHKKFNLVMQRKSYI